MDRAKGPVQPLRSVVIGPATPSEPPGAPPGTPPSNEASLTRLFRMTPQDPEAVSSRDAPVATPRAEEQQTLPRMEPITRFFSADELLSRAERVNPHGFGSGEFKTVPRSTLPVGTVPAVTSAPPPPVSAPSRADADDPVKLPYVWGPKLKGGFSARRVVMVLLAVAAAFVFLAGPALRTKLEREPVKHTARSANTLPTPGTTPGTPANASGAPAATATPVPTTPLATSTSAPTPASVTERGTAAHGPTAERAAIDAVAEGRYAAALDLYRKLASENPSDPSYRDAARILTARLTSPP